jgi:branched-chain amino acid transport system substrate-binding protein
VTGRQPRLRQAPGGVAEAQTKTVFADFAVDERGFQTANQGLFIQWQDGAKMVVWPDELATGKPRFPTLPWSQR